MTERKRILFNAVLGLLLAAALITGLDVLSQPGRQSTLVEKTTLSTPPTASSDGWSGQYAGTVERIGVVSTPNLWQLLPVFISIIAAFAAYTYTRIRTG